MNGETERGFRRGRMGEKVFGDEGVKVVFCENEWLGGLGLFKTDNLCRRKRGD